MIPSLSGALGLWFLLGQVLPVVLPATDANLKGRCEGGSPLVICLSPVQAGPRVAVLQGPTALLSGSPLICVAQAIQAEDDDELIMPKPPSRWLGVLLTPVPAPLAAHIGADGLMIANVVKDSPADQAGLERYDVLTEFDGQKVADSQGLIDAIGKVKPGDQAEIVFIRGGQKRQLNIAPAKRPPASEQEYKYEEPEEEVIDQTLRLRGHRLRPGPGGAWIFEELGPLHGFPDVLKNLQKLHLEDFDFDPDDFRLELDFALPSLDLWTLDEDDEDADVRIELRIEVDDDGNVTQLRRDADGKIHVKRIDPDGNESSATYDSAEELQESDPEAFKLYDRVSSRGAGIWIHKRPHAKKLRSLRESFQFEAQEKLRDALERAQEAYREAARKPHRRVTPDEDTAETISVEIGDAGKITVTTREGDTRTIYEFDDKDDFKKSEPALYERVKRLFE